MGGAVAAELSSWQWHAHQCLLQGCIWLLRTWRMNSRGFKGFCSDGVCRSVGLSGVQAGLFSNV
jgi:hypothetical protein